MCSTCVQKLQLHFDPKHPALRVRAILATAHVVNEDEMDLLGGANDIIAMYIYSYLPDELVATERK